MQSGAADSPRAPGLTSECCSFRGSQPFRWELSRFCFSFSTLRLNNCKISSGSSNADKPNFFIEGGIHSREWISPATVIYMTGQMLSQYKTNKTFSEFVDKFNWYIVPVVNVDGYVFTWTTDRKWRKTRSKNKDSKCIGVDPNRNWDVHWCEAGASKDPCSDSYCGPSAFSESEVKGVADFVQKVGMKGFIDFHSFSQLWMSPWGYTKKLPDDYKAQIKGSELAVKALESVHGTKYQYGTIANIIYVASGSSADWTYGEAKVKYSYGVELRDTGKHGFILPPEQIIPSGEETLAALIALANYVYDN
ncbi:hypothetical protein FSP39_005738 [Pinctada imbricata]|uniref:Peptidase M14 domain-containing protein n=1 Tax=Pinctada imbricata TaxID=66713 RepID=A0AA89BNP3_PINIB|nr:hypothetical protein FSP39_005738 [Pinctada imbricata]